MKWKLILLLMILFFNIKIFSQEFYQGYRVVSWEEIQGMDYSIIRDAGGHQVIEIESTGEIVVVSYEN